MTLGQKVIGRKNDGWYYHCTIVGMATQTFYEVGFDDGSYCDNLQPENVLVSAWQSDPGPLPEIFWVIAVRVKRLGGFNSCDCSPVGWGEKKKTAHARRLRPSCQGFCETHTVLPPPPPLHPPRRQSHDCLRSGPPSVGELITVAMPDGQTLSAFFNRQHTHNLYQVRSGAAWI